MKDAAHELRLQEHPLYFKSVLLLELAHPAFKFFANLTEMFGFCQMLDVTLMCSLIHIQHKKIRSVIL